MDFIQRKKAGNFERRPGWADKKKEKKQKRKLNKQLKSGLSKIEGKKLMQYIEDAPNDDNDDPFGDNSGDGDIVMKSAN